MASMVAARCRSSALRGVASLVHVPMRAAGGYFARAIASSAACRAAADAGVGGDGSHSDFSPQPVQKAANASDPALLRKQVDELIKAHKVVLFMKGTPASPQCGFSAQVVRLLHFHGADIHGVDVLSNPSLRALMKEYSGWPTFPQLYVSGEFVGGRDIAVGLHESGELKKMLDAPLK